MRAQHRHLRRDLAAAEPKAQLREQRNAEHREGGRDQQCLPDEPVDEPLTDLPLPGAGVEDMFWYLLGGSLVGSGGLFAWLKKKKWL